MPIFPGQEFDARGWYTPEGEAQSRQRAAEYQRQQSLQSALAGRELAGRPARAAALDAGDMANAARWGAERAARPDGAPNARPDILELRGGWPALTSGYGAASPSNLDILNQNSRNAEAGNKAMIARGAADQGKAAVADVDLRASAMADPLARLAKLVDAGLPPDMAQDVSDRNPPAPRPGVMAGSSTPANVGLPFAAVRVLGYQNGSPTTPLLDAVNQIRDRNLVPPGQGDAAIADLESRYGKEAVDQVEHPSGFWRSPAIALTGLPQLGSMLSPVRGNEDKAAAYLQSLRARKLGVKSAAPANVGVPPSAMGFGPFSMFK